MVFKPNKFYFLVFLGIFLFSIILMNRIIRSTLKGPSSSTSSSEENQNEDTEVFIEKNSKYHLVADDPAKYNIKSQGEHDVPLTEQQWEYRMRQGLKSSPSSHENPGLSLEGVQKTPEEIEKRIKDLTAQIKAQETIILNNSGDRHAQDKLQTLYMLKATLMVLKEKVASPK